MAQSVTVNDVPMEPPPKHGEFNGKRARIEPDENGGQNDYVLYMDGIAHGPPGSTHSFGAGNAGIPGCVAYKDWKPPPATSTKHNKSWYFEIENANFEFLNYQLTIGGQAVTFNQMKAPYYNWLWYYLCFYIDQFQFNWYMTQTNYAKIKAAQFQIIFHGHRLPFTTNDETSSIANSAVDQTMDVFTGIEDNHPFTTCKRDGSSVFEEFTDLNDLEEWLYGHNPHARDWFASPVDKVTPGMGYRKYHFRPQWNYVGDYDYDEASPTQPGHHFTWPSFADEKAQSIDLRTFQRGTPIYSIGYKPKNGIIHMAPTSRERAERGLVPTNAYCYIHKPQKWFFRDPIINNIDKRNMTRGQFQYNLNFGLTPDETHMNSQARNDATLFTFDL